MTQSLKSTCWDSKELPQNQNQTIIFILKHNFQFRTKYGSPLQSWWSPKPEGFLSYPCFFSDRDLHFILHLNDRKSRWNVRAQTMVSAVGGLALAARAARQARRNIWGRLGFVPTNFWRKASSHNYYFLEKKNFKWRKILYDNAWNNWPQPVL